MESESKEKEQQRKEAQKAAEAANKASFPPPALPLFPIPLRLLLCFLPRAPPPPLRPSPLLPAPHRLPPRNPCQTLAKELAAELTKEWGPLVENLQKAID